MAKGRRCLYDLAREILFLVSPDSTAIRPRIGLGRNLAFQDHPWWAPSSATRESDKPSGPSIAHCIGFGGLAQGNRQKSGR
jgi:hypothetical protein